MPIHYVDSDASLKSAIKAIQNADKCAVDTEADSLHHYTEKLCLFQINAGKLNFVCDPFAAIDFKEIMRALEGKPLIFHGADYDLRLLKRTYGFKPRKIFDTLLAAQILGLKGLGLAALVEKYCDVKLPKTNQKADWSRRPLNASMVEYAANDVRYLPVVAETLEEELGRLGRLDWLKESCNDLILHTQKERETEGRVRWRIKGSGTLHDRELTLLKGVWQWREDEAEKRDRPPFKVLSNEALIGIAVWSAQHRSESLSRIASKYRQLKSHHLGAIEEKLKRAWEMNPEKFLDLRVAKSGRRLTQDEKRKVSLLKGARKKFSDGLKCEPGVLASNAALEKIVTSAPGCVEDLGKFKLLKTWQLAVVGQEFVDILNNASDGSDSPETEIDIA